MTTPSVYKPKLPKELSFPVGTMAICEKLLVNPSDDNISILYNDELGSGMGLFQPGFAMVRMKGESKDLLHFSQVMSISYSQFSDKWIISVYPISLKRVRMVKQFLKEKGLDLLAEWFTAPRIQTWYEGHRYFILGMNDDCSEFCIWETFNDRTERKEINTTHNKS